MLRMLNSFKYKLKYLRISVNISKDLKKLYTNYKNLEIKIIFYKNFYFLVVYVFINLLSELLNYN